MTKSNNILVSSIIALIIAIITVFLGSYYSTGTPEMFIDQECNSEININNPTITFTVTNRGDDTGYKNICFNSTTVGFIIAENKSHFCFTDTIEKPIEASMTKMPKKIDLIFLKDKLPETFIIQINCNCYSKVWDYIHKECKGSTLKCEYKKSEDKYILI